MNYYQVLGVLPDAEHVVIVAAYRALAGKYHPDKWKGDVGVANNRMAEINAAYAVLSDAEKRKRYDESRGSDHGRMDDDVDSTEEAFDAAIAEYEDKWNLACEIYPDLIDIRKRLTKTARRLAFAFVILVVESKKYKDRHELANTMEGNFLRIYFGSNPKIIAYVKQLIEWGFKDAVKRLNVIIDLLGDEVEDDVVIKKIEGEFSLEDRRRSILDVKAKESGLSRRLEQIKNRLAFYPVSTEAFEYARLVGYEVLVEKGGFFKSDHYAIRYGNSGAFSFETNDRSEMCLWITRNVLK